MKPNALVALALLLALIAPIAASAVEPSAAVSAASDPDLAGAELRTSTDGFQFLAHEGPVVGDGELRTYRVEVDPATGINPWVFTNIAERIIGDARGWTGTGHWALQRTGDHRADIRLLVATPKTVDRLCARAGLDTHGEVSCWNGEFAAINVDRWRSGADGFVGSLRSYRQYVLNHELGHGLGYGHEQCPRRGARAPVMQQQTYATRPCVANGWPTRDPG